MEEVMARAGCAECRVAPGGVRAGKGARENPGVGRGQAALGVDRR